MNRVHRLAASACAVALFVASNVSVRAQNARNGVRVEYTTIETQGGLTGRAFLPFSSRDVALIDDGRAPSAGCPATPRVRATARLPRGAVREVSLVLALRAPARFPLDPVRCPEATIDTRLEDDTVLRGGRGEISVSALASSEAGPGWITGSFSQTALRAGSPVTVRGEFRIPLPATVALPRAGADTR